ncbi:retinaldehyde-binding protein 1-like [Argonauta hians]
MVSVYDHILKKGSLTPALVEKARVQLYETEDNLSSCISELRKVILENKSCDEGQQVYEMVENNNDDEFLLRFLRARKFDVKKTYGLLKGHLKFHQKYSQLTTDLTLESVRPCLERGYPCLLTSRDKEGRTVFFFSIENWDSSEFPFLVIMKAYLYLLQKLIVNQQTQVNGCVLIENFHNYSLKQAWGLKTSELKAMVDILQGSFPARFQGVHVINEPWYFSWTYAMVKPFLKRKLSKKVFVHGYNLDNFWEYFDKKTMPKEFGGEGPSYDPQVLIKALEKLEQA